MDIEIKSLGAVGDGKTMNTAIIQRAIDECTAAGGGRVIISDGTYMTGTIILKDNVELHIAADGVLLASPNGLDFPERDDVKHVDSKKLPRWKNGCMIFAEECKNIGITGYGKIDVNGDKYTMPRDPEKKRGWLYRRIDGPTPPRVVFFTGCQNIKVEDVTMTNQPACWSFWIHDCDYVTFDKVKVLANVNYPNNDGIHINASRDVTVSNCILTNGDDCIIVRCNNSSLKEDKICERIVVSNCTLTSYASGILVGFVNCGTIRNCSFSNIVMTDCSWGIRMHMPYIDPNGSGIGSADLGRNAADIENISFNNIIMDKVGSIPIHIYVADEEFVKVKQIKNIYFNNIHATSAEPIYLKGKKDCHLKNFYFTNCSFDIVDGSEINQRFDRPMWYKDTEPHPMVTRYIDNLNFNNTEFSFL